MGLRFRLSTIILFRILASLAWILCVRLLLLNTTEPNQQNVTMAASVDLECHCKRMSQTDSMRENDTAQRTIQ